MEIKAMKPLNDFISTKAFVFLFFFILIVWIGTYLFYYTENSHGFILGDWLVNYHDGGFKRRGLSGSLFFILQDITGLRLQLLVYSFQLILYLIFFIMIGKIIYQERISPIFLTLILSPLTFLFYFNDSHILGRKEIILFVIFAYFIYLNKKNEFKGNREYAIYILLFFATFLHEIIVFYLPYFILSINLFKRETKLITYISLSLSVLLPTLLIFFFGGLINEGHSLELLSQRGVHFPENKINIFDFDNALFYSLERYRSAPIGYSLYLVSFIFGTVHFGYYLKMEFKENFKTIIAYFLLAIIYSLPLFVLVCDWGRWLHIHFILLFLILAGKLSGNNSFMSFPDLFGKRKMGISFILIILFLFTWRVYHFKLGFSLDGMFCALIKKVFVYAITMYAIVI